MLENSEIYSLKPESQENIPEALPVTEEDEKLIFNDKTKKFKEIKDQVRALRKAQKAGKPVDSELMQLEQEGKQLYRELTKGAARIKRLRKLRKVEEEKTIIIEQGRKKIGLDKKPKKVKEKNSED